VEGRACGPTYTLSWCWRESVNILLVMNVTLNFYSLVNLTPLVLSLAYFDFTRTPVIALNPDACTYNLPMSIRMPLRLLQSSAGFVGMTPASWKLLERRVGRRGERSQVMVAHVLPDGTAVDHPAKMI
jgi:hypothetical protein